MVPGPRMGEQKSSKRNQGKKANVSVKMLKRNSSLDEGDNLSNSDKCGSLNSQGAKNDHLLSLKGSKAN